ncbi:MAG: AraC family transcriptional regulator [Treponema sp.]|jgi:AraC-like DNA-binding protein|nr:AraC family transcriptional regulator [Treponema sp.]
MGYHRIPTVKKSDVARPEALLHYLPFSEEDEKLGMVCTNVGNVEVPPYVEYPPNKNRHPAIFRNVAEGRTLPNFHIIYITKGKGIFEAEGKSYTVLPGSVFFLLPGLKHRYKPVFEVGWHEYWVGFQGKAFFKLLEEGILSRECVFSESGLHDNMIAAFNMIIDEVKTQAPLFQLKACAGVLSLIAEILTRNRRKEQINNYQRIVEKAKSLMEANVLGAINLPGISGQIGISTSRFNEIFKTYTSMTPYQYYMQLKIKKAADMLEQKDASIKEVAYALGFDDQYYFSRFFKKKTGVAPSAWRKLI